ncbi:MAG: DUF1223 domain-containing protein [Pseudodonghicola sp.]|nr:DUF1223 domain-containing protein [Pseudodonghicola sp.]
MKRPTAIGTALVMMLWTGLAAPAVAQDRGPMVVEMFTSQGCSACPPADALLRELAEREDVLPLAQHVEYWDYIGWQDSFADPANTLRQKGYARAAGRDMIYTPQMIVMGQEDVVGAHAMQLAELIMQHMKLAPQVLLTAHREEGQLHVGVRPAAASVAGPLEVLMVRYAPLRRVEITRGENAGRTLDYANVVEGWTLLGEWDGQGPLDLSANVPVDAGHRDAIVVQRVGFGPILAAAKVR